MLSSAVGSHPLSMLPASSQLPRYIKFDPCYGRSQAPSICHTREGELGREGGKPFLHMYKGTGPISVMCGQVLFQVSLAMIAEGSRLE